MSRKAKPTRYNGGIQGPPTDLDDFDDWLNCWADLHFKHQGKAVRGDHTTRWGYGYQQAVSDIREAFLRVRGGEQSEG